MLPTFFASFLLISGIAAMPWWPTATKPAEPTVVELVKRADFTGVRPNTFNYRYSFPDIFMLRRNAIGAALPDLASAITRMTAARVNVHAVGMGATRYARMREVQSEHNR
jgi:hypothetical protein